MQVDADETRECPDCGGILPAQQAQCGCGTIVPIRIDQDIPVAIHSSAVFDRIYLVVSSCWIALCVVDVARASAGLVHRPFVFSTPGILYLAAFLHGAIGLGAVLHEEWLKTLVGMLCYLQIAAALGGAVFAFFLMPFEQLLVTQGYFVFLIALSIAQIALLCDSD